MSKLLLKLLVLCLAPLLPLIAAQAQVLPEGITKVRSVEGIDEYALANGLQVLLFADDSKPTTTVNLTVHVGSRQENYGETGMAHLLEHMMFKGTPTHPTVWSEFTARGLAANGSTSFDRTNYTASFSANPDNLQWYLSWLSDALVNSTVARKALDTEMTVVRNEMERGENSPSRILMQRTMAVMYDWHHYGNATIGARSDVENVDIPRLQAFYHQYYQPDNATLIVSGRFDTAQVLHWVADTFGKLPRPTRKLPTLYTLDPAQDGERSVTLRRNGGAPLLMAAYHVQAGSAPDFAATELLAQILGDSPSGRLYKQLTATGLASSAFAFAWDLHDPGVLFTGAELAPGQDLAKARDALLKVNESFAQQPVTDEEVQRARTQWLNGWERQFTDPEAVGMALSGSVALGDWRLFFLQRDRIRAVTQADVQRVAEAYLLRSNRTLGSYIPTDHPQRAPAPAMVDLAQTMKDFKPQAAVATVAAFEATPANIDAHTQRFSVGGLSAAVLPKPTRGNAVQAVLTLRFGDEQSLFGQGYAGDAVADLLDKGSTGLTRQQVQDRLQELQTDLSISSSAQQVTFTLSSKRDQLPAAIALVAQLARTPTFPAEALDEFKRQVLTQIESQRKEPGAVAANALSREGNPYPRGDVRHARSFDEMVEDVNALSRDQLLDYYQRFYGARKGEFGAAGDMDVAAVKAALDKGFADWNAGADFTRVPHPLIANKPERLLLDTPDKANAVMRVRQYMPINDTETDYPALTMANHLLGSGGSSRLWKRIREGEGLSYSVGSGVAWSNFEDNSAWLASAIFAPQNREKVETAFRDVVARALKDGFTEKELQEGRSGVLNYRRLSRAQDEVLASVLASNLYLGRSFALSAKVDAEIAALTVEQVNAVLRKYVKPEDFVAVFAGDFKP